MAAIDAYLRDIHMRDHRECGFDVYNRVRRQSAMRRLALRWMYVKEITITSSEQQLSLPDPF